MGKRVRVPVRGRYVSGDNERIRRKCQRDAKSAHARQQRGGATPARRKTMRVGWSKGCAGGKVKKVKRQLAEVTLNSSA